MPNLLQRRSVGGAFRGRGALLLQQVHDGARAVLDAVVLRALRWRHGQPRHRRRPRRLHRQMEKAVGSIWNTISIG